MSAGVQEPLAETCAEGKRLADIMREQKVMAVLVGGIAIYLRCPSASQPNLRREYKDIDFVTERSMVVRLTSLLEANGHAPDTRFNALHGGQRLFFWDSRHGRQLDVFVDRFEMCHAFDWRRRVAADSPALTLPFADLLLTKLQVVEINYKDLQDSAALLQDHPLTRDDAGVNLDYITSLTRSNWGLQRTIEKTIQKLRAAVETLAVSGARYALNNQLNELQTALDAAPKSTAWNLRSKLGERKRWYELPEESRA